MEVRRRQSQQNHVFRVLRLQEPGIQMRFGIPRCSRKTQEGMRQGRKRHGRVYDTDTLYGRRRRYATTQVR